MVYYNHAVTEAQLEHPIAAWLESGGRKLPIRGDCSLGRSPGNSVVVDSQKVSRRHAIINVQNIGEFWLIDLGSSNGTYLSGRRIHQPVKLSDQDQMIIGDQIFIFHQPEQITEEYRRTIAERTIRQIENIPCWLLVADIENFTPLSRSLGSDQLAELIGGWVANCKEIIESHQGIIDKYLGDGFLAHWRGNPNPNNIAAVLAKLKEAQVDNKPAFRFVLHFGSVAIGGVPSMGEESLMGREVNFVFRMEKLAGFLGVPILTSAVAKSKLKTLLEFESAGEHDLKGFDGKFEFFSC
jgi:class 3 adenylate cyclase